MKKIVIVNASARESGNSSKAAEFLSEEIYKMLPDVTLARINLWEMNIHPCMGDAWCRRNEECMQEDDMKWIISALTESDFTIFLSPVFFRDMSSLMKIFTDRCYPMISGNPGSQSPKKKGKKCMLVMFQYIKNSVFGDDALKHTSWVLENLGFDVTSSFLFKGADDFGSASEDEKNRQKLVKALQSVNGGTK